MSRGDWEEAEIAFCEALEADPNDVEANLGMARMALEAGYPEDVHGFTRKVPEGNEKAATLEYAASLALGKKDEAIENALHFLGRTPVAEDLRIRVGFDLLEAERFVEAMSLFRKGKELEPANHLFIGGEAAACLGLGRLDDSRRLIEQRLRLLPNDPCVGSHWVALHAGKRSVDVSEMLAVSREWDRRFGRHGERNGMGISARKPGEKLRVGFVSSTFRHHANCQFLLPLLESLDRGKLAVFAYHDGSHEDEVTGRCRAATDGFRKIHGLPDLHAVKVIKADKLDVLVDINAHFDGARLQLFTYRPARVQVHYLGGVGTTGLKTMDWRLADELTEPPDRPDSASGTERIFRIDGGIHAFRPLSPTALPDSLPMLRNGYVTFGSLNSLTKMEDEVLELWGRCLEAVPASRLRLVKQAFRHASNREDFSRRAAKLGIDPSRLDLVSAETSAFSDLSVYHGIDIALDTFAYNGITTTCEALWMGVPVVTLQGNRFVAREAAAILTRIGHPEWISTTREGYVEIARSLAQDASRLATIRSSLRTVFQRSPVHDPERLANQFSDFLFQVSQVPNS